jgi:hypothetical protein
MSTVQYNHATHGLSTKEEVCQKWLMFSKFWSCYNKTQDPDETNTTTIMHVLANSSEEDEMFSLTATEIVEAQQADNKLKHLLKHNSVLDKGQELELVENKGCMCTKDRLIIPKPLQWCAVMWYHHYLLHPGHTHLEVTMKSAYVMTKGMRTTIRSIKKSCNTCQLNKHGHTNMGISHLKS